MILESFPNLVDLSLHGNPAIENLEESEHSEYREMVSAQFADISILDG